MNNLIKIWLNQDTNIALKGIKSPITNEYINDATGTATVKDRTGTTLAGPVSFEHVTDSDGEYVAVIPEIVGAVAGTRIKVVAELSAGTGFGSEGEWEYNGIFEARTQYSDCGC